jgi:trans-aconitate methyltransferase
MAKSAPSYLATVAAAYDGVAEVYAERFADVLDRQPLERALLSAFADVVRDLAGPVADLGCGPGYATAYLHRSGLDVFGVDLSPEMVADEAAAGVHAYDHRVTGAYRWPPDHLAGLVEQAGCPVPGSLVSSRLKLATFEVKSHLMWSAVVS